MWDAYTINTQTQTQQTTYVLDTCIQSCVARLLALLHFYTQEWKQSGYARLTYTHACSDTHTYVRTDTHTYERTDTQSSG